MAGEAAEARFTSGALDALRDSIAEAGGNEVFFVGRLDAERRISEVEPRARGNAGAAPALLGAARPGEVVIHNHPSGELLPSNADLGVASSLGNLGVGFLIIDNPVTRVYTVVEPHVLRPRTELAGDAQDDDFGPEGALAASLSGYEYRESQLEMARAVARAFDEDGVAMVEAGTGTGKSFAYLFPAARSSLENGEKVVVSTNTINLQAQLIEKDAPAVARALGREVRVVLVKGRTNYICRRKLAEAIREPGLFDEDGARSQLEAIGRFAADSEEGSRQELGFVPHAEVWERVQSESDTTLRVRCPHYNECFFYNSRRRAATADVVVANHHLLLSDAQIRRELGYGVSALLPPFKRLIIDEAHHLEDAATSHMAEQLSRRGLARMLGRLLSPRSAARGHLPTLVSRLQDLAPRHGGEEARRLIRRLADEVLPAHRRLAARVDDELSALEEGFVGCFGAGRDGREEKRRVVAAFRETAYWREVLAPGVAALAGQVREYAELLEGTLKLAESLPEEVVSRVAGPLLDARSGARRLEQKSTALRFFLVDDEDHCRWIEYRPRARGTIFRLCHAPVEVGPLLREVLFDRLSTVVLTSATLQTGGGFDYLLGRLGLGAEEPRLRTLALKSPFDYSRQAFVGVTKDLPPPDSPLFGRALAAAVHRIVDESRGRAFVLFTSYRLLEEVYARVARKLEADGIRALKQGTADRHRLLEEFREDVGSVLFATSSFWEGVDVPGDALQVVIITKLPFAVPDEPILQARTEKIEARGGDAFLEYSLPQAVLRFRQGFGRLIRRSDDVGAVVVADRRVVYKRYGKVFLEGLPVEDVLVAPAAELAEQVGRFLRGESITVLEPT